MIEQRHIWGSLVIVVLMMFFAGQIDSQAAFSVDEVQSLFNTQSSFGDLVQQREEGGLKLLEDGCFSGQSDWGCLGYDAVGLVEIVYLFKFAKKPYTPQTFITAIKTFSLR